MESFSYMMLFEAGGLLAVYSNKHKSVKKANRPRRQPVEKIEERGGVELGSDQYHCQKQII